MTAVTVIRQNIVKKRRVFYYIEEDLYLYTRLRKLTEKPSSSHHILIKNTPTGNEAS